MCISLLKSQNPAKLYIKCVKTGGVRGYIKHTKVIVQNTSRIRLVDVQFPITASPPPCMCTNTVVSWASLCELGQLVEGLL